MMITLVFLSLVLSIFVGMAGSHRTIGFWGAFLLSVFLSPLVGIIGVAISSRSKKQAEVDPFITDPYKEKREREAYYNLKKQKEMGLITDQEFETQKHQIFSS